MDQRLFVRFSRRFEDYVFRGYVLAVGPRFFLLSVVSDRIRFEGFECFRMSDVTNLRPEPHATFAEAALRKRGKRTPKDPRVKVGSIEEVLLSANRAFPLVTIHCERLDPDVCYVGRVVGIERGRLSLLGISPDATWDETPNDHALKDITRVSFGGDYENALHLVGGSPESPVQPSRPKRRTPRRGR